MKIFQALSNVKHNGEVIAAKSFIEGEIEQFAELIKLGAMKIVEGAKTLAEAEAIVAGEVSATIESEENKPAESQNTWGPTKEPVVAPTQPTEVVPPVDVNKPADVVAPTTTKNVNNDAPVQTTGVVTPADANKPADESGANL